MMAPPLIQTVLDGGVSLWLDDLGRDRLTSGELQRLIDEWGVTGVTTNPSIFATAITQGAEIYAAALDDAARQSATAEQTVVDLMVEDVREACGHLLEVHRRAEGRDGFVSIEVDPRLARDAEATIAQAQTLWDRIDHPNAMIKIPATVEGLPAITEVLARGINVNVTLIFGLDRYRDVRSAHAHGVRCAIERGRDISRLASVASFFVSRLDTAVDSRIDAELANASMGPERRLVLSTLRGCTAVMNAQQAYADYLEHVNGPEWSLLALQGAIPQRPLWASTGTKDPSFSPVKYVAELVTPGAVNTVPMATLTTLAQLPVSDDADGEAALDALDPGTLAAAAVAGSNVVDDLSLRGLDYAAIVRELEAAGVAAFETAWVTLLDNVEQSLHRRAGFAS